MTASIIWSGKPGLPYRHHVATSTFGQERTLRQGEGNLQAWEGRSKEEEEEEIDFTDGQQVENLVTKRRKGGEDRT
ncbi:hypothetical protein CMUS01_16687 [Colletotrichum musicola]|uniref:Uncharacterized protein n=1 Tax=Colletotrichum musicola TaxID=2175873 RepID=A0A8H6ILZ4_9PEZI|nr:hypothetical protein CMUS01_16687 [Colletotrichum musicola]